MNAITTPTQPDVVWPKPSVNNVKGALDDASCRVERITALFDSNNADFNDLIVEDGFPEGWLGSRLYSIWMIYLTTSEKVAEVGNLVQAITEAVYRPPVGPVGKHVELARRRDWVAAVEAYRAAEAVPMPPDADDAVFDSIAIPASDAFRAMLATRAPDFRAFHEKLTLCRQNDAWTLDGAVDALFADVEFFARAEIAAAKLED